MWFDAWAFRKNEVEVVAQVVAASGAAALVSVCSWCEDKAGTKRGAARSWTGAGTEVAGWGANHTGDWDVLWSTRKKTQPAREHLRPDQLVMYVSGTLALSNKEGLAETLERAYGGDGYPYWPKSYRLPAQLREARADLQSGGTAGARQWFREAVEPEWWIVKGKGHVGKGITLVPHKHAEEHIARRSAKKPALLQRYITNPLLLEGKKFGLRLWVFITGVEPTVRMYLSEKGLCIVSAKRYQNLPDNVANVTAKSKTGMASGHFTNAGLNEGGATMPLEEFWARMEGTHGKGPVSALRGKLLDAVARAFDAGVRAMRNASGAPEAQLFGLDFMVDEDLHPWLLEINSTPSTAVGGTADKADTRGDQKRAMLSDAFSLLSVRLPGLLPAGGSGGSAWDEPGVLDAWAAGAAGRNVAACERWAAGGEGERTRSLVERGCVECLAKEDVEAIVLGERELTRRGSFEPLTAPLSAMAGLGYGWADHVWRVWRDKRPAAAATTGSAAGEALRAMLCPPQPNASFFEL